MFHYFLTQLGRMSTLTRALVILFKIAVAYVFELCPRYCILFAMDWILLKNLKNVNVLLACAIDDIVRNALITFYHIYSYPLPTCS